MKVLVTGAKGQLGMTLKKLYENNTDKIEFTFLSKEELDITNNKALKKQFRLAKYDYCINCAAHTNVEQAEKAPEMAYKINAEAVSNLAKECKENNVVLIHISTDYVFDGEKTEPYTIHDKPNPINEYGKSKLLGEQYIQNILDKYFIIRTSWLYSKEFGRNFYKTILNKAKLEKEISITTSQKGCPTDAVSLSKYIYSIIIEEDKNYGLKHLVDREVMTWYSFAKKILSKNKLLDQITLVKADNYFTFAKRPKYSVLLNTE